MWQLGNTVLPKRCFQWVGCRQLYLHIAKRFSSSHQWMNHQWGGHRGEMLEPFRIIGQARSISETAKSILGWGWWGLAFTHVLYFVRTVRGMLRDCTEERDPPVPAQRALILEGEPPRKQLWYKTVTSWWGAQEKFSTWKRSASLPTPFIGEETEAERDQSNPYKVIRQCESWDSSGGLLGVHLKPCSTCCHKNQLCFHKQFGSLHNRVQLHPYSVIFQGNTSDIFSK